MKKLIFAIIFSAILAACSGKVYNSALKQIQLGMSTDQVIGLMGEDYQTTGQHNSWGKVFESLKYVDRYKYQWIFDFENDRLIKWYKETEEGNR